MDVTNQKVDSFDQFLRQQGLLDPAVFDKLQIYLSSKAGKDSLTKASQIEVILAYLESQRLFSSEDSAKAKSAYFNLPYVDLKSVNIDKKILELMPFESLSYYQITPFKQVDNRLSVAIFDPSNMQTLQALEFLGQKNNIQIELFVASLDGIIGVAGKKQQIGNIVTEAAKEIQNKQIQVNTKIPEEVLKDAPIVKIVDVILSNAIESNASDIHIEPTDKEVRVRYRVDGILHNSLVMPRSILPAIVTRVKILSNLKIDETRLPQDGRFHFEHNDRSVDLRVSVLPLIYGEKIVMRILDKSVSVPTLEQLGLVATSLTLVKENLKKPHGIFLITGPTGSGKSTTLYSMLSLINTQGTNIVTMEDPVEYFIPGVNQSQVNPEIGLTFASGLRSILRQDPNVVMVGEIRDAETAELAVHAALTGHLVFSTLHTNNAIGAIPRLIDMGIEPFLLVASLNAVAAQRLVRKICIDCKEEKKPSVGVMEEIRKELEGVPAAYLEGVDLKNILIYEGKGCERCDDTGYRGRLAIFEVLIINTDIHQLILAKASALEYYEPAKKMGMINIKQDGLIKVLKGITTLDEVLRVTSE